MGTEIIWLVSWPVLMYITWLLVWNVIKKMESK